MLRADFLRGAAQRRLVPFVEYHADKGIMRCGQEHCALFIIRRDCQTKPVSKPAKSFLTSLSRPHQTARAIMCLPQSPLPPFTIRCGLNSAYRSSTDLFDPNYCSCHDSDK